MRSAVDQGPAFRVNGPLLYITAFAVLLGVLIVFHELGHYVMARLCGVKVLRFSLGFGRVLWKKRFGRDGTEWVVSLFPLGGYVKMLDEREGGVSPVEAHRAFNRQGVGARSLIVAAGPAANFLLAIFLYWGIFLHGNNELLPIFGVPPEGSPAAMAGVKNGDLVRSVNGQSVATWTDLRWLLLKEAADSASVELEVINEQRESRQIRLDLGVIEERGWEGDAIDSLGIRFYRPDLPAVVGKVVVGGPAAQAGMLVNDRVLDIDGQRLGDWRDLVSIVRTSEGRSMHFRVDRAGELIELDITPEMVAERGQSVGKIGVAVAENSSLHREISTFVSYGLLEAGKRAVSETWEQSRFSLHMMGKMVVGQVSLKNLSGPVTIADYAGQSARLGFAYYIKFMALLSVSLGVLNLLPIPMLDGGHLLYHMIEVVRRRPVSERVMEVGQRVGMSILFALMAFAFFNDITRLFNG